MSLGKAIRKQRKALKMTQKALAEKVDISLNHMQYIEQGKRNPSLMVLRRLSDILSIDFAKLLLILPQEMRVKLQLEEIFDPDSGIDVWFKSARLSERDKEMLRAVLEATLMRWEEEKQKAKQEEEPRKEK